MPKTFTDDVNPVWESPIIGPYRVVKAEDHQSYIEIDPANRQISAAGVGRPFRQLSVPGLRGYGITVNAVVGTGMDARSLGTSSDAGMYFVPFALPVDMDVTEVSSVYALAVPAVFPNSGNVRFELTASVGNHENAVIDSNIVTVDWPAPGTWGLSNLQAILLDNGSGHTLDGGAFQAGDVIGFRLLRIGSAAEDTFNQSIHIAMALMFEYTASKY